MNLQVRRNKAALIVAIATGVAMSACYGAPTFYFENAGVTQSGSTYTYFVLRKLPNAGCEREGGQETYAKVIQLVNVV